MQAGKQAVQKNHRQPTQNTVIPSDGNGTPGEHQCPEELNYIYIYVYQLLPRGYLAGQPFTADRSPDRTPIGSARYIYEISVVVQFRSIHLS